MTVSLFTKVIESKYSYTNLKKGNIGIGKTKYLENGLSVNDVKSYIDKQDLKLYGIDDCIIDPWDVLSKLYQLYKHSIPSKHKVSCVFKAISFEDMTDIDLINGIDRCKAKKILESYIMIASYINLLKWVDDSKWFWQDDNDSDFIILKKYLLN